MSHYGGLPVSYPWEPVHWTDAVTEDAQSASQFYDAGNDVYAFAIRVLFPSAQTTSWHNSGYLGDVIEAILGVCWLCQQSTSIGVLLALASKYIYSLKTLLSIDSLDVIDNRRQLTDFITAKTQYNHHQTQVTSPNLQPDRVSLPEGWFGDDERAYLTKLLQHLCTDAPPLLCICDEVRTELGVDLTNVKDDASERVHGEPRNTSHAAVTFTMADVPKHKGMQRGSTKAANEKLKQYRDKYACQLTQSLGGFEINITSDDWWRVWLAKAKFKVPLEEIIGDGVVEILFEAPPWIDPNTKQLRTDFTIITQHQRVRLHPQSSGKESLPVFVPHDQRFMPRGTIEQTTHSKQAHVGFSQHDLISDKQAWRWAAEQTAPRDLTNDATFGWERWTCHANWAKDLTIITFGIALDNITTEPTLQSAGTMPYFWCRASREAAVLHFEIRKSNKTTAHPISERTYKEKYARLCQNAQKSFYPSSRIE